MDGMDTMIACQVAMMIPPPEDKDDYYLPPECYLPTFKDCIPLLVMCGIGLIGVVAILYFGS